MKGGFDVLNKNFYTTVYTAHMTSANEYFSVKTSNGSINNIGKSYLASSSSINICGAMTRRLPGNEGVQFGSGRTRPTVDDYCLDEIITSGITVTTPSAITRNIRETYEEISGSYGITASENVTIGEIGLFLWCQGSSGGFVYMVDRTWWIVHF